MTVEFSVQEVKHFWGGILGLHTRHSDHAEWITTENTRHATLLGWEMGDI